MYRYYYLLASILFFIGAIRVFMLKRFEFKYYEPLKLGEYTYLVSILFLIIGIYFFQLYKNKDKK